MFCRVTMGAVLTFGMLAIIKCGFIIIALHCILLYCTVLYRIVLYSIVSYHIVLYRIVLYRIVSHCIVLYCIALYCKKRNPTGDGMMTSFARFRLTTTYPSRLFSIPSSPTMTLPPFQDLSEPRSPSAPKAEMTSSIPLDGDVFPFAPSALAAARWRFLDAFSLFWRHKKQTTTMRAQAMSREPVTRTTTMMS